MAPLVKRSSKLTAYTPVTRQYNPSPSSTLTGEDVDFYRDTTQAWCQAKCDAHAACKGFVFGTPDNGDCTNCCWLKQSVIGGPQTSGGTTSYLLVTSTPARIGKYECLA
jgi:hypothetical protein